MTKPFLCGRVWSMAPPQKKAGGRGSGGPGSRLLSWILHRSDCERLRTWKMENKREKPLRCFDTRYEVRRVPEVRCWATGDGTGGGALAVVVVVVVLFVLLPSPAGGAMLCAGCKNARSRFEISASCADPLFSTSTPPSRMLEHPKIEVAKSRTGNPSIAPLLSR